MTIALGCAAAVLAAAVLILALKVCALKSSLRELAVQAEEKYRESSNAPLSPPQSADKGVRRLAGELTAQLDEVIAARRQYAEGNGELLRAVTNVSHDLRTPLTSIAGYLGLLRSSGLNDKQIEFVDIIGGRVAAMKKLTEELLVYSVAASGEEEMPAGRVCLNDCLEDSLTQFYVSFAERGIEPKIDICAARVERSYNKDALSRIFGNILSNAVRYSDGDLCVRLEETGRIEFENSASRLDGVSAGKLFDRFFTVENARGSVGLGLSIAKLLTEKSGGKIAASWRAGRLKIVLCL